MLALSPASSFASAPHSGSHANMLSAAGAGCTHSGSGSSMQQSIHDVLLSIAMASELVRAVRAEAVDVLQEDLVVGGAET